MSSIKSAEVELTDIQRMANALQLELEHYTILDLAKAVSNGFPVKTATAVRKMTGPKDFGKILSNSTYERAKRNKSHLSKDSSEKLYDFIRVRDRAIQIFNKDANAANRFLNRPHMKLEGETPFALAVSSTAGADAVLYLLDQVDAGFAA